MTRNRDQQTNLVSKLVVSTERQLRRAFYAEVLSSGNIRPETDLQNLCAAWLKATGAEWVWLWLKHDGERHNTLWELTAAVGKGGYSKSLVPAESHNVALKDHLSVAEFCSRLKRPVFVDDIVNWERKLVAEGPSYKVVCAEELLSRKCCSFLAVPLIFAGVDENAEAQKLRFPEKNLKGLICSHFIGYLNTEPLQTEESLMLMGRATSQAIATSFSAARRYIVFELGKLAAKYLTAQNENVIQKRHEYLKTVISLIREHLHVQYLSVFYQTSDRERIECIATTGLRNQSGPLHPARLTEAKYEKKENYITSRVFATGEPFVSKMGDEPNMPGRTKYKWRETPDDVPEPYLPWVCYPIKKPETEEVLGVLRCVGNHSLLAEASELRRNFDPIQIEALDFISQQLAPVLETLATYIRRERVISIIKHDLEAPLKMIKDSIVQAAAQLDKGKAPNTYFVDDLLCCIHTAMSLAQGLDQSPTDIRGFDPTPTWMEGEIVAVIRNMLSHFAKSHSNMDVKFNKLGDDEGRISEAFPKRLWLDRNLIARALTNVIWNAVKYGEPNTTIYVTGRKVDGRGYYLDVENQGVGISEEEKNRIFEEGFRSKRTAHKAIGVGMGLPIARAIMEKHKGRLDLTSLANPTVFSFFFPQHLTRS